MTVFTPPKNIKILRLEDIPQGTTRINLYYCHFLTELPENLPDGLTEIDVHLCRSLKKLPEKLPQSLTKLNANGCSNLERLPDLEEGITEIDISWCKSLKKFPERLPQSLIKLNISSCRNLEELPENLPANLQFLDLSGCFKLPNSPALITQLRELENRNRDNPNFELIWPVHIDQTAGKATEVKQLITGAYKQYYSTNPDFRDREPNATDGANYPTLKLFHRFLSESVGDRGGAEKIAESAFITAQKIAQNPQLFKFIDEHSKTYLDACVNQPVAGFTEISMMVDITTQLDVRSKLEAARMLMSVEVIRQETRNLIGNATHVEVELANAFLIEVCKELRVEWPGVPQGIAYGDMIQSFLTTENINSVATQVREVLQKPVKDIVEYICCSHQEDFWADITLTTEEKDEINEPLNTLKERFSEEEDPSKQAKLAEKILRSETECRGKILRISKEKTLRILRAPLTRDIQEDDPFEIPPQPAAQNPEASNSGRWASTATEENFNLTKKEFLNKIQNSLAEEDSHIRKKYSLFKPSTSLEKIIALAIPEQSDRRLTSRLRDEIQITPEIVEKVKTALNEKFPNSPDGFNQISFASFREIFDEKDSVRASRN